MTAEGERFISEPVQPAPGSFDTAAMARGEPGLPARFTWRETEYRVVEVLRQWKTTGPCSSGSSERYVRRHWFTVRTDPAAAMTLYCDRQSRSRKPKARWWLLSGNVACRCRCRHDPRVGLAARAQRVVGRRAPDSRGLHLSHAPRRRNRDDRRVPARGVGHAAVGVHRAVHGGESRDRNLRRLQGSARPRHKHNHQFRVWPKDTKVRQGRQIRVLIRTSWRLASCCLFSFARKGSSGCVHTGPHERIQKTPAP